MSITGSYGDALSSVSSTGIGEHQGLSLLDNGTFSRFFISQFRGSDYEPSERSGGCNFEMNGTYTISSSEITFTVDTTGTRLRHDAMVADYEGFPSVAHFLKEKGYVFKGIKKTEGIEIEGGVFFTDIPISINMPDGLILRGIGEAEEENRFIVEEMIERVYFRNGVRIEEEDEVWDVGAHCGLFLWAMVQEAVGDFRYVGFEPVERSRGALRENVKTLLGTGGNWTIYGVAVGKDAGEAEMTHYPRMPGNSALEGHVGERREARATAMKPETARRLEERAEAVRVEIRPLSSFEGRPTVLKIDVEGAELEVLEGIGEEQWKGLRCVVGEVHDVDGRLETVKGLLEGRGFGVVLEPAGGVADAFILSAIKKI